ncbi:MAG TPA: hypothetical protein VHW67_12510 [Solirubrobacteraceae bacterium]|jgi:hypothetical protein|nr:hypothetical protein [Solirubrobacteraceae bacterium]
MLTLIAAAAALLATGFGPAAGNAAADTPAHTDVMFLFDTSGSMGSVLSEAKAEIAGVIEHINATLPDAHYGVAEVRDYPFSESEAEGSEKPWKLDQPLTADSSAVKTAIEPLFASGGGDFPESYGRALWETDTNPNVGWRDEARHVIVLVADNVPHDHELDEGIPEADWAVAPPWDTGEEFGGLWAIPGSQWTSATNLDFQSTMTELGLDGKPLEDVDFSGPSGYLPYWEHWAALSGGHALGGAGGNLATSLTTLIETGATTALAPCPSGQERSATGVCVVAGKPASHPTVSQVICNLVIATASDTCTATIGDAAPSGSTNPTGTVTFASSNGGVFSSGNTCTLTPTPLSGNVSSCSVQFLPPAKPSTFPAITVTYSGDATHNSSTAQTHYGAASELARSIDLSEAGTIRPNGEIEIPIDCGFPCESQGELFNEPDFGNIASAASLGGVEAIAESAASKGKHKKKKKKKPVLLGKGKVKLKKAGKGKLILKPTAKGKGALAHFKGKSVHLTLKFTIRTPNGTVVESKKQRITLRPKAKKKAHKKKH